MVGKLSSFRIFGKAHPIADMHEITRHIALLMWRERKQVSQSQGGRTRLYDADTANVHIRRSIASRYQANLFP
jgi:hypothetical protein